MPNTELSLEVSREPNPKVLRLIDTSHYSDDVNIDNYQISVLAPNKKTHVYFGVNKNFSLFLNSCNLKYSVYSSIDKLVEIPDGIYEISMSYSNSNCSEESTFYHLRTIQLRLKFLSSLCNHFENECKKSIRQQAEESLKLEEIRNYIDAAEYEVSCRHDKRLGLKYYNKANELLKTFNNECGC